MTRDEVCRALAETARTCRTREEFHRKALALFENLTHSGGWLPEYKYVRRVYRSIIDPMGAPNMRTVYGRCVYNETSKTSIVEWLAIDVTSITKEVWDAISDLPLPYMGGWPSNVWYAAWPYSEDVYWLRTPVDMLIEEDEYIEDDEMYE